MHTDIVEKMRVQNVAILVKGITYLLYQVDTRRTLLHVLNIMNICSGNVIRTRDVILKA